MIISQTPMIHLLLTLVLFLIFLLLSLFTFYLSGFGLISKVKEIEKVETIIISYVAGLMLFTLLTILLGFLKVRTFILPTIIIFNVWVLFRFGLRPIKTLGETFKDKLLTLLIILAILVQGIINFPSGYPYQDGLYFWSAHGHDGIRHIAFMEAIKKEFPPKNPLFSGENIYNYHYLVDVVMGQWLNIFPFFSSWDLYFRFFPVLFSYLITLAVFAFVKAWKNQQIAYWAIIFTTFTGSFGWIVKVFKDQGLFGGETVFWASQLNTVIGNPATAISIPLFLTTLLALNYYIKGKNEWFFISLFSSLFLSGFKVFAAVVLLVGMTVTSIFNLIRGKFRLVIITAVLGFSNLITFFSMTTKANSLLFYEPWWLIRTLIVSTDRLDWMDLELRRQYYLSLHTFKGYLRVAEYELIGLGLFLFGNLGTRIIGFYSLGKNLLKRNLNSLEAIIFFALITGLVIPLLFVQKGLAYNNIQFMQYSILLFGFFAAISTYHLLKKIPSHKSKIAIATLIIVLGIPTVIGNMLEFYGPKKSPNAKISQHELQGLLFLRDHSSPQSIILTAPFQKISLAPTSLPRPIYAWYSTGYVSAVSARSTYFSDEEQAITTGYPEQERINSMTKFFNQQDYSWNKNFLKENKINYIYLPKNELLTSNLDEKANQIRKFYENAEVIIYEVTY